MDALIMQLEPVREFAKDSVRLVKRCTKPDRKEFTKIATATAIGFAIMGFIGFFVKLIHIPINNIIVGAWSSRQKEMGPNVIIINHDFLIPPWHISSKINSSPAPPRILNFMNICRLSLKRLSNLTFASSSSSHPSLSSSSHPTSPIIISQALPRYLKVAPELKDLDSRFIHVTRKCWTSPNIKTFVSPSSLLSSLHLAWTLCPLGLLFYRPFTMSFCPCHSALSYTRRDLWNHLHNEGRIKTGRGWGLEVGCHFWGRIARTSISTWF